MRAREREKRIHEQEMTREALINIERKIEMERVLADLKDRVVSLETRVDTLSIQINRADRETGVD